MKKRHVVHWECSECRQSQVVAFEGDEESYRSWLELMQRGLVCSRCGSVGNSTMTGHVQIIDAQPQGYNSSDHRFFGGIRP